MSFCREWMGVGVSREACCTRKSEGGGHAPGLSIAPVALMPLAGDMRLRGPDRDQRQRLGRAVHCQQPLHVAQCRSRTSSSPGHQVRRKVEVVPLAISSDPELRALLDLTEDRVPTHHHGWIADTSIECDHQRFAGFLKVSVEELLIALRDDRHLLNDPEGLLDGNYGADPSHEADASRAAWTLYPDGFSAERFIEVIESEAVWDLRDRTQHRPSTQ